MRRPIVWIILVVAAAILLSVLSSGGPSYTQVKTSDVTYSQVVELITAGRSGELGLQRAAVGVDSAAAPGAQQANDENGAR